MIHRTRPATAIAALSTVGLLLAACGGGDEPAVSGQPAETIDDLIAAAQEEGSLVFYASPSETASQALADAFAEEYDISVEMLRIVSGPMSQRFAAEAEAGAPGADALLINLSSFNKAAIENGWVTPLADAEIPGYPWDYPEEFLRPDSGTAIAQLQIRGIAYNTDLVSEADAPSTWEEMTSAKWQGEMGVADPSSAPVYVGHWWTIAEQIGPDYLSQVGAQDLEVYESGAPSVGALAAGEIAMHPMTIQSLVNEAKNDGAPIEFVVPDTTTADEMSIALAAEAQHPNAARLFVHYVLSEEGNKVLTEAAGETSVYDSDNLPSNLLSWETNVPDDHLDDVTSQLGI